MSTVFGPLRHGNLTKYGYSTTNSVTRRRTALSKAEKKYGPLKLYHKLDAVAKLSVKRAPRASKVFRADRQWVLSHLTRKRRSH